MQMECLTSSFQLSELNTYGVRLGALPPVGPAVPDSQIVYVLPSVDLTLLAKPDTTSVVGPA